MLPPIEPRPEPPPPRDPGPAPFLSPDETIAGPLRVNGPLPVRPGTVAPGTSGGGLILPTPRENPSEVIAPRQEV